MTRARVVVLTISLGLIIALVYGAVVVQHGFSARDEPSAIEAWSARRLRQLAIPAGARDLTNPVIPGPEAIREGMHHFADHCALCHANNGSGDTEIGRKLYPKAPDMRAARTQNLSDAEIYYIIQNGIRLTGMPAWGNAGNSNDEESWKLVHFIRHLPSLTKAEEAEMARWNPISPLEIENNKQEDKFLEGAPAAPAAPHQHKKPR